MLNSRHTSNLESFSQCFGGLSLTTTNPEKAAEYRAMFPGERVPIVRLEVPALTGTPERLRSWVPLLANRQYQQLAEAVSAEKAQQAFALNGDRPIVTEESLLFIPHLDGWPGPYIGDLDSKAARDVLIKQAYGDRGATTPGDVVVCTTLALYTPEHGVQFRHGFLDGCIPPHPRGESGFSWDPIVQPRINGMVSNRTFAEMDVREKNGCSMRYLAVLALKQDPFRF